MKVFVDIQGFKTESNEFILKEIAIANENTIQVFLIKPPYPYYNLTKVERKQVSWIERNRKIFWKEGYIPFSSYKNLIVPLLEKKNIYAKGQEKVKWIQKEVPDSKVFNLEDIQCPNLLSLNSDFCNASEILSCPYHSTICALKNVMCLRKWCDNKLNF